MAGQYMQRQVAEPVGYLLWQGLGALLMMGLMVAGLVVVCICIGSDLLGALHS